MHNLHVELRLRSGALSTIFCCAATSRWTLTSARYFSTCLCRACTFGSAAGIGPPDPRVDGTWPAPDSLNEC
eukprot:11977679-Alexandrium_andersonii.AAC.1